MDCGEANAYGERHSVLMGAIFMCNRMTKKECLERKLFGLPSRQAGFLKKIKAGMLLFLFEHEERKLYGVFEATSDGALNIIPNAFLSSGKTYPAQILFKRVWFCKPLSEDEFRGAINENYYQPYKFDFGLSYDQVLRLIHLFSLKKIRVSQYQRGMPNKLIKQCENSYLDKERARGKPCSSFDSYEHKPLLTSDDFLVASQHGLVPTVPCATRTLPDSTRSSSQNDYALRRTFPITSAYGHHCYHTVPRCEAEHPSIDLGLNRPSLAEELNTHTRYFSDTQVPYLRSQLSLLSDPKTFELPSSNYRRMDVSTSGETYKGTSCSICEPSSVSLPLIGSVGYPKTFTGSGGCTDRQDYELSSILDHHDSSAGKIFTTPGMNMTKGIDSRSPLHGLGDAHGDPKATLQDDGLRGQHCWDAGHSPDFIRLSEDDSYFHASLSKDASVVSDSSLESEEGNDSEELRPYQLMHGHGYEVGYYPTSASSGFHSDNHQKRTSVFSRLSKASETRRQCKVVHNPYRNLSLDQLLNTSSQRRDLLSQTDKMVPQISIIQDDDQFEKIADTEPMLTSSVGEFKTNSEEVAEESSEIPFMNFKRRSEARKMEVGKEARADIEGCRDEGSLGKRRRLIRPSFCEDECEDVQKSSNEIVGGGVFVKNGDAANTGDADSSVRIYEESGSRNSSSPDDSLSCVIDKSKIDSNGSNTCANDRV